MLLRSVPTYLYHGSPTAEVVPVPHPGSKRERERYKNVGLSTLVCSQEKLKAGGPLGTGAREGGGERNHSRVFVLFSNGRPQGAPVWES